MNWKGLFFQLCLCPTLGGGAYHSTNFPLLCPPGCPVPWSPDDPSGEGHRQSHPRLCRQGLGAPPPGLEGRRAAGQTGLEDVDCVRSRGGPSGPRGQRSGLAKMPKGRDVDCSREGSPESGLPLLGTHLSAYSGEHHAGYWANYTHEHLDPSRFRAWGHPGHLTPPNHESCLSSGLPTPDL